jgi:hypothetical protein
VFYSIHFLLFPPNLNKTSQLNALFSFRFLYFNYHKKNEKVNIWSFLSCLAVYSFTLRCVVGVSSAAIRRCFVVDSFTPAVGFVIDLAAVGSFALPVVG